MCVVLYAATWDIEATTSGHETDAGTSTSSLNDSGPQRERAPNAAREFSTSGAQQRWQVQSSTAPGLGHSATADTDSGSAHVLETRYPYVHRTLQTQQSGANAPRTQETATRLIDEGVEARVSVELHHNVQAHPVGRCGRAVSECLCRLSAQRMYPTPHVVEHAEGETKHNKVQHAHTSTCCTADVHAEQSSGLTSCGSLGRRRIESIPAGCVLRPGYSARRKF